MVNYEMLSIGENNFKSIQLRTFHCLRFKKLSDKMRLKSTAFYQCERSFLEVQKLGLISGFYPWDLM